MKETSVFSLVLDYDLGNLPNLPKEYKKILKDIEDAFNDTIGNITKSIQSLLPDKQIANSLQQSATAQLPNINVAKSPGGGISKIKLVKKAPFVVGVAVNLFGEDVVDYVTKELMTDLERLKELETQVIVLRRQATAALEDVEKFGERPGAIDETGLPLVKESILKRIDSLNSLLENVSEVEEQLTTFKLKAGTNEQPNIINFVPRIPIPVGNVNIGAEPLDMVEPLEKELLDILEGGNKALEERSQLLPLLGTAYASLGNPLSMISIGEGMMSDAMRSGTVSAVELGEKGIDPLAGKLSTFSGSFSEVLAGVGDGAVIFGFTKDELENYSKITGNANETNEQFIDSLAIQNETLKSGSDILELTDEELLNLKDKYALLSDESGYYTDAVKRTSGETADLIDKNKALVPAQEQMTQAVADGSAVMDNAGASAEQFGEALEQVESSGGFFDGIKQGFIDFVENVESNSELMADFFADTLSNMSQNFSDFFYNAVTGKFESLADVAKNAFKSILKSFLDLVSAIATRQIVISIGGLFGIGKTAQAAGGGNPADIAQQGAGVVGSGLGLFGSGGAFSTLGQGLGIVSPGIGLTGEIGPLGVPMIGELAGPGFMATAGAAVTVVGAVLAAAALAFTIIAPFLKKTPRMDIDFDSIKTEAGRRAALVSELLDDDFFVEDIAQISVKRKAGLGVGGNDRIKEMEETEYRMAA